jgi:hypothetical protein
VQAFWRNEPGVPASVLSNAVVVRLIPALTLRVFPNPFNPGRAVRGTLKFTGIPEGGEAVIYTLSGREVRRLKGIRRHSLEWDALNEAGERVVPGVYLYLVEERNGKDRRPIGRGKIGLVK